MAFDEQRAGVSAERAGSRVVHGTTGDDAFGLADVGDDGLEREADASGRSCQTRKAERGAHDFEEAAARDGVDPFGGAFGKFAMQSLFEFLGAGEFFERAPVFGAGFFALVVRDGGVEAFADGGQVQGFRRTDVFAFFDLDQTRRVFIVVRHAYELRFFRPFGAGSLFSQLSHGLRRGLQSFAASRLGSLLLVPQGLKPHPYS